MTKTDKPTCAYEKCYEQNNLDWYFAGSSLVGLKALCCPKHGKLWENEGR